MRLSFTNPWWVVAGAVGGLVVCNGPVLAFTFGVFLKPIMADMGWQRGTASFALSFGGVCSALMVPVIGRMMDRWSIRRAALPGLVVYAFAMCLLGLSPKSLVIFTLLFALAEAASAVQTPIGYAKAIAAWFDRRRGCACRAAADRPWRFRRGSGGNHGDLCLGYDGRPTARRLFGRSHLCALCRNGIFPRPDRRFRSS